MHAGKVYFQETFEDGNSWQDRWVQSTFYDDEGTTGEWQLSSGQWRPVDGGMGLRTAKDNSHYVVCSSNQGSQSSFTTCILPHHQTNPSLLRFLPAQISAPLTSPVAREKDLVVQFQVKHEQTIECGGGFIKLLPEDTDQAKFSHISPFQ